MTKAHRFERKALFMLDGFIGAVVAIVINALLDHAFNIPFMLRLLIAALGAALVGFVLGRLRATRSPKDARNAPREP